MDAELKQRWVAALKSGNYLQGSGALKTMDDDGTVRHCCLGVLCEIMENVVESKPAVYGYEADFVFGEDDYGDEITSSSDIPTPLASEIGFRPGDQSTLVEMNDAHGKSFIEIAEYIETHL